MSPPSSPTNTTLSPFTPGAWTVRTQSHSRWRTPPCTCSTPARSQGGSSPGPSSPSASSRSCSGAFRNSPKLLRLDQPVVPVAAPVEDVDLARVRVAEDEEVVADQLQLEGSLLGRHRLDRELL